MPSSNALSICRASTGLSMTKPISVLSRTERGSRLNEPTKARSPSTAKVLACRLDAELPNGPAPASRFVSAVSRCIS